MTIRVINPPRGSESYYYIQSNVKTVDQFNIYFHDGSSTPKKLCAKVELVSVMDVPLCCDCHRRADCPATVDCAGDFYKSIGCTTYNKILEREVSDLGGYKKMSMEQFEALDILTHL